MANARKCPLCGNKVTPDNGQWPNHIGEDGSLCPLSIRPVDDSKDDAVVDGQGPAAL